MEKYDKMKKIGIMTMHRIINYGSYLQAYSLKKIIENITDSKVEFVDYKYEKSIVDNMEEANSWIKKFKNNKNPINYFKKKKFLKKNSKQYEDDLRLIGVSKKNYNHDIDMLVIGSDEVFNCMQGYPVGYSRTLFGKTYEDIKVISYAGSFGHTSYEEMIKYGIADEVADMLKRFDAISVRDDNSRRIVMKMGIKLVYKHLDPVLIYEFKEEKCNAKLKIDNYIIVYAYTARLSSDEEKYIKLFAHKYGKKIVSIGYFSAIADFNISCNPLEVFEYFQRADYVITDTFHGTIFSIKTNSKFCTIIRESNRNKIMDLLTTLNRTDRVVNELGDIEKLYNTAIDYDITNKIIFRERNNSIQFLSSMISQIEEK